MTFVTTILQDGRSRKILVSLLWELVAASVKEVSRTIVDYGSEARMAKCEGPDIDPEFAGVRRSELEDSRWNSLPVRNGEDDITS